MAGQDEAKEALTDVYKRQALMLGGLMIHGIVPGPLLFVTNGELVYSIFTALFLAAIFMLVLEFGGMRIFIRILGVKKYILMPIVMILCLSLIHIWISGACTRPMFRWPCARRYFTASRALSLASRCV